MEAMTMVTVAVRVQEEIVLESEGLSKSRHRKKIDTEVGDAQG